MEDPEQDVAMADTVPADFSQGLEEEAAEPPIQAADAAEGAGPPVEDAARSPAKTQEEPTIGAAPGLPMERSPEKSSAAKAQEAEELASLSLPISTIRRIARTAAPNHRLTTEVTAGLHRIAQAFICYATDRSLAELQNEAERARKHKSKAAVVPKKTLYPEHVMRFLMAESPHLANKLANLFPEMMPGEFKPLSVRLLEQLHKQYLLPADQASEVKQSQALDTEDSLEVERGQIPTPARAGKRKMEGLMGKAKKQKTQLTQLFKAAT